MSEWIGVIRNATTGLILAVVNPDEDTELDNPRLLLLRGGAELEPVMMVKVPRDEYMSALSMDDVARIVERLVCE
jgi:hypothetical protein